MPPYPWVKSEVTSEIYAISDAIGTSIKFGKYLSWVQ